MGDYITPMAPSSFYLEFSGVCEGEKSYFKSVSIPDYSPKVEGGQQALASTKGGKALWQVNATGHEGLFTIDCVCYASGDSSSTSMIMWDWFEKCLPASSGGKSQLSQSKVEGSITAYSADDTEIARWEFIDAWPSKYKCGDCDVSGSANIEETFTITCEKFNRTL